MVADASHHGTTTTASSTQYEISIYNSINFGDPCINSLDTYLCGIVSRAIFLPGGTLQAYVDIA